jgi:hypothetical protein
VNRYLRACLAAVILAALPFQAFGAQQPDAQRVRQHPLYGMLQQLDRQIAALRATLQIPGISNAGALSGAAVKQAALHLNAAAAIERSVEAAGAADRATETNALASLARGGDAGGIDAYRGALAATQTNALSAYSRALDDRVARAYRRRAAQFDETESTFAFTLGRRDAPAILPLRVRLDDLQPDAQTRNALLARLNATLKRESDALSALHARDQAALATYRAELAASAQRDYTSEVRDAQRRTANNLRARSGVADPISGAPLPAWQPYRLDGGDVDRTATNFQAEGGRIAARAQAVRAVSTESTRETLAQIATLINERRALYAELLAETK